MMDVWCIVTLYHLWHGNINIACIRCLFTRHCSSAEKSHACTVWSLLYMFRLFSETEFSFSFLKYNGWVSFFFWSRAWELLDKFHHTPDTSLYLTLLDCLLLYIPSKTLKYGAGPCGSHSLICLHPGVECGSTDWPAFILLLLLSLHLG